MTVSFSSLNTFRKFSSLLGNAFAPCACVEQGIHWNTFPRFHFWNIYLMSVLLLLWTTCKLCEDAVKMAFVFLALRNFQDLSSMITQTRDYNRYGKF